MTRPCSRAHIPTTFSPCSLFQTAVTCDGDHPQTPLLHTHMRMPWDMPWDMPWAPYPIPLRSHGPYTAITPTQRSCRDCTFVHQGLPTTPCPNPVLQLPSRRHWLYIALHARASQPANRHHSSAVAKTGSYTGGHTHTAPQAAPALQRGPATITPCHMACICPRSHTRNRRPPRHFASPAAAHL